MIEMLIVLVVVGAVALLAVPSLQKGMSAAQSGSTVASLRTISNTQVSYYTRNSRFARLTEINNLLGGEIGTPSGSEVYQGRFVISMVPVAPTDAELQEGYTITAMRNVPSEDVTYLYEVNKTGEIRQILP